MTCYKTLINNKIETDPTFTKSNSRYREWHQSFFTVKNTLDGIETMRMTQKDQIRHIGNHGVNQNHVVRHLLE